MLLTARTERVEPLKVLAASRREVRIRLETSEPLRKPRPRQAAWVRRQRTSARAVVEADFAKRRRSAFRGPIAVRLDLQLPPGYEDLGLRRTTKEYLDILKGIAFADDAVIDHLEVQLFEGSMDKAVADLRFLPLSVFCDDFDRAFWLGSELGPSVAERHQDGRFDEYDGAMLSHEESLLEMLNSINADEDEQLDEDPDGFVDLDIPSSYPEFYDREVRDSTAAYLERSTALTRGRWLCDQLLDWRDRPGAAPSWVDEACELDTADVLSLADAGPGCFVVPAPPRRTTPPGGKSWKWHVERAVAAQLSRDRMLSAQFAGPVALDIAFRGGCGNHADVDNLAHSVVGAFKHILRRSRAEIRGYRAYRLDGGGPDVRVRMMTQRRLLGLGTAMDRARDLVLNERAARARATA